MFLYCTWTVWYSACPFSRLNRLQIFWQLFFEKIILSYPLLIWVFTWMFQMDRGVKSPADISMNISKLVQILDISPVPFTDGVRLTLAAETTEWFCIGHSNDMQFIHCCFGFEGSMTQIWLLKSVNCFSKLVSFSWFFHKRHASFFVFQSIKILRISVHHYPLALF